MGRVYHIQKLIFDPSQGFLLAEQLRAAGLRCEEFLFTSSSVGRLASSLMQSLRSRLLELPDDDELRQELLSVRLRESSPNVYRVDTVGSGHDDRVIAVSMAVHSLTTSFRPNSFVRQMEAEHPIHIACGTVNPANATKCSGCGASLTPAVPEAAAGAVGPQSVQVQPPGWYWRPIPDRMPTPETAAALSMLEQARRQGTLRPY